MKKFSLIHESGDIVKSVIVQDREFALDYFSALKQLPVKTLLEIYDVVESEARNPRRI